MGNSTEQVALEDYEKMLRKANLEESKKPLRTFATLRQCFRTLKHDYNAFLEMYPVRKTDVINLERRIANMEKRLKIATDDYHELEICIANARVHKQQHRLDLVLIDYQSILYRAGKLNQKELLKQYQQIFDEAQNEYDEKIATLKNSIEQVDESESSKDYSSALSHIEQILQIAPKLGKSELVKEYSDLAAKLEKEFEKEEAEKAAEEKAKREEKARNQAQEEEEQRKKEELERKKLEETEHRMREEMIQKKREEELKKQKEEEERIRIEEAPLFEEKTESVQKKSSELKAAKEQVSVEKLKTTPPTEISQIPVQKILLIEPKALNKLSADHLANFSSTQLRNLSKEQVQALSQEQIQSLSFDQITTFTGKQMQYFTPEQVQMFTPLQIQDIAPEQWQALTYDQVQALTPEQLAGLSAEDWNEWDPEMLRWLTKDQLPHVIRHFTSDQVQFFTPQQLSWILDDLSDDRVQVVSQQHIQTLTQTTSKQVGEWIQWSTNIQKEDSEQLLQLANSLVDVQKIPKPNRYNLSRYALLQLLKKKRK
ncbi:hypothetical protein [Candidatus Lokiarchaeum ossiferum]|uniref:hypothetical protein n=1 Tax=Candidatus Lokiarchaeum ossiferum TaxID=2951803 RepID=UPI00352D8BDE